MSKNKIVTLSDIHIGTNSPTNWYQKSIHEPYLSAIIDDVINRASEIQELILLGDVFDFWTYPPNVQPPAFADIIKANPKIFGVDGKLSKVCKALPGKVTYVNGNHDMNVTKGDWDQVKQLYNYQINYCADPMYYINTAGGKKIAFSHGHTFTLFNAPFTHTNISPLPVGFFITRSVAYHLNKTLKPGQTVAELQDQGAPNGIDLAGLVSSVEKLIASGNLVSAVLDYIMKVTGMPEKEPIVLLDGQTKTIEDAKTMYKDLQNQWIKDWGGGTDGGLALAKSAIADFDGTYIAWFAQQSALTSNSDLIVLGHTHAPKLGITNGLVQYANNGFECPSSPDIPQKKITFSVVNTDDCQATLSQVTKQNNTYQITPYSASPDSVIAGPSKDFSCYVIIDNTHGKSDLSLTDSTNEQGHYVVTPPKKIGPGQQGKFWLQDDPLLVGGVHGTEGSVTYMVENKSRKLTYACPTGISSNSCSGANFYTSNDGVSWSGLDEIKTSGHPFFVKFIINGGSKKATLRIISLECHETEDWGADEAYLQINGQKFWGPISLNNGESASIDKTFEFATSAKITLFDQDSGTILDPDDNLGTLTATVDQIGKGEQRGSFNKEGANYTLVWEVLA